MLSWVDQVKLSVWSELPTTRGVQATPTCLECDGRGWSVDDGITLRGHRDSGPCSEGTKQTSGKGRS